MDFTLLGIEDWRRKHTLSEQYTLLFSTPGRRRRCRFFFANTHGCLFIFITIPPFFFGTKPCDGSFVTPQTFNSSHSLRFSIHGNVFVASLFWKRTIHSPSNTTAHALHGIITNYITLKPNQNPKTHDHTYIYIYI